MRIPLAQDVSGQLGAPFPVLLHGGVTRDASAVTIANIGEMIARLTAARLQQDRRLSGAELGFLRKSAGLTVDQLAAQMGIGAGEYREFESDVRPMSPGNEKFVRLRLFHAVKRQLGETDEGRASMDSYMDYIFETWRGKPVSAYAERSVTLTHVKGRWMQTGESGD